MRRITELFPAKYKIKQALCPAARSQGIVATTTPKKQESSDLGGEGGRLLDGKQSDPIVAFSRPPPLPPVLGPLLPVSLFEMWSGHDGDDD